MTVATQPAHDIRPDKAATANYYYFHVVVLDALSISVVLIEGSSMRIWWREDLVAALAFPWIALGYSSWAFE